METLGILLLALLVLTGGVATYCSLQLGGSRPCTKCGKSFRIDKRETVSELIDGRFRYRCDECDGR